MPKPLIAAAHRLVDVLDRENEVLKVMDLPRAALLLSEKTAAIADLIASGEAASGLRDAALVPIARRLDGLAKENQRLLARAIVAQQRVLAIVVRAAASVAETPCYGAKGQRPRLAAVAYSTRA